MCRKLESSASMPICGTGLSLIFPAGSKTTNGRRWRTRNPFVVRAASILGTEAREVTSQTSFSFLSNLIIAARAEFQSACSCESMRKSAIRAANYGSYGMAARDTGFPQTNRTKPNFGTPEKEKDEFTVIDESRLSMNKRQSSFIG